MARLFRRIPDLARLGRLAAGLCFLAFTTEAAVPAPEQLLPDDTLLVLTAPDFAKLRQICQKSPKGRLWNDPAMKPVRDKFYSRWHEEVVKPLEQELNLSFDTYASLLQGQATFAVTRNAWQGDDKQPLGYLLLLDTRDKAGLLRTNLAELRKKWVAAGRALKTEQIRNLEFSVFPVTTNGMPGTLSRFLWRPPAFPQVITGPETRQVPVYPSNKGDMALDLLIVLLTTSKELVVGQVDSMLVAGNSVKGVEKVVIRLTGGAAPTLGETAAYQASQQPRFRDAPFYGWANVKAFVDSLSRKSPEPKASEAAPDPFEPLKPDKLIAATGLGGCKTLAFDLRDSDDGSLFEMFLNVPEAERQGVFQILANPPRDASPPPFVPSDATQFFRWRMDGPKAWATFEKMLNDLSPQALSAINLILDTANARAKQDDPGFDLKKTLLANLGDDIIRYQRASRPAAPAGSQPPPSLFLLGSPNADLLALTLKRLFVIFPQGDAFTEREFLGRKIYSVPMPPLPLLGASIPQTTPAGTLSCAASGGYVAMSTDTTLLEEYLRSNQTQIKALRETPGLVEASQPVGGMGTGFFGYENLAGTMRATFEAARNDPGSSTNGIGPCLLPALPGITGPEENLSIWIDFSLLPAFDSVAQYYYSTVYALGANTDGLTLKVFTPTPPALRSNSAPKLAN